MKNFTNIISLCLLLISTTLFAGNIHPGGNQHLLWKPDMHLPPAMKMPVGTLVNHRNNANKREVVHYIALYDSASHWALDPGNNTWINPPYARLMNFTYDGHNNLTSYKVQRYTGSGYVDSAQTIYTYDGVNELLTVWSQFWNGSSWVDNVKYTYTYDGNHNNTTYIFQANTGYGLMNENQYIYTYGTNHNVTSYTEQLWFSGDWVNVNYYTYTYDGDYNVIQEINQSWASTTWLNTDKYIATYDGSHNLLTVTEQGWVGSDWQNSNLDVLTYNEVDSLTADTSSVWSTSAWVYSTLAVITRDGNNNSIHEVDQDYSSLSWINDYEYVRTYDGSHNMLTETGQYWDNPDWVGDYRDIMTYNGNSKMTGRTSEIWEGSEFIKVEVLSEAYDVYGIQQSLAYKGYDNTGTLIAGDSTWIYQRDVVGIQEPGKAFGNVTLYPNPAGNVLNIEANIGAKGIVTILIYDVSGRIVSEGFNILDYGTSKQIDIANLKEGVYLLELQSADITAVKQFVKEQ